MCVFCCFFYFFFFFQAEDGIRDDLVTGVQTCALPIWQYSCAKKELAKDDWRQDLVEILYRPFDKRWTVFNRHVAVHRRERVMRHMLAAENIGLTIGRAGQVINQDQWDIVFCTRHITEFNLFRRGGNTLFPPYLYSPAEDRTVNLA